MRKRKSCLSGHDSEKTSNFFLLLLKMCWFLERTALGKGLINRFLGLHFQQYIMEIICFCMPSSSSLFMSNACVSALAHGFSQYHSSTNTDRARLPFLTWSSSRHPLHASTVQLRITEHTRYLHSLNVLLPLSPASVTSLRFTNCNQQFLSRTRINST